MDGFKVGVGDGSPFHAVGGCSRRKEHIGLKASVRADIKPAVESSKLG